MMKKAFYLTLKSLFILKMLNFLSWRFGQAERQLDYKYKISFKIYDVQYGK